VVALSVRWKTEAAALICRATSTPGDSDATRSLAASYCDEKVANEIRVWHLVIENGY
jgi:hypothetical protein